MTRFTVAALAVVVLGTVAVVAAARALGLRGSRASTLSSVAAHWLGAWVLWGFVGHLAVVAGLLSVYEPLLFAVVGLPAAWWQYRALLAAAPDRGRAIFVGAQLAWLVIVLARNRLLGPTGGNLLW
jgi:hypothetical protein